MMVPDGYICRMIKLNNKDILYLLIQKMCNDHKKNDVQDSAVFYTGCWRYVGILLALFLQ